MNKQTIGWSFLFLIATSCIARVSGFPEPNRKFAAKPGDKKPTFPVYTPPDKQELAPAGQGFSLTNMLNMAMQFFLGALNTFSSSGTAVDKQDSANPGLQGANTGFSWTKILSVGLQLLLSAFGGGGTGVDKVDSPANSAMTNVMTTVLSMVMGGDDPQSVAVMAKQAGELLNLVMTLFDALKTSFSERALSARSLGQEDLLADAGVAAATMVEGYARTFVSEDEICMHKSVCEANRDCVAITSDTGYLFCQIGSYLTAQALRRSSSDPLEAYSDAAMRGRNGDDCAIVYNQCNDL